jgi:opacity protein-like surface antigen
MRCLLAALGLIGLLSPAFLSQASAADYELPTLRGTETFVPARPTYFSWDGFYAGGHISYTSLQSDFSGATQPLVAYSLRNSTVLAQMTPDQWPVLGSRATSSAGVGGFVGYNFQWDNAIIGLELNYTHASLGAGAPSSPLARKQFIGGQINDVSIDASGSLHVTDFATTRARLGWAAGSFMPYLTLGLAFGRADEAVATNVTDVVSDPSTTPPTVLAVFFFPNSQAKNGAYLYGLSGGGGLDFALTQNIFARAEYEYIQWQRLWQIESGIHNFRAGLGVKF